MKCAIIFVLFAAILATVCALPCQGGGMICGLPPSHPYYGRTNPRGRRSPVEGKITVDQPVNKDATVHADLYHPIYDGKYGYVEVYGSASKTASSNTQAEGGIRGVIPLGGGMSDSARMAEIDRMRKEMKID